MKNTSHKSRHVAELYTFIDFILFVLSLLLNSISLERSILIECIFCSFLFNSSSRVVVSRMYELRLVLCLRFLEGAQIPDGGQYKRRASLFPPTVRQPLHL